MTNGVLGLIPARGGSKAIPGKNIAPLLGRSLLSYTADAALTAGCFDRVLLSTDDQTIAAAGRALGIEVPFLRPDALARDDTPILPVIEHALNWCAANGGEPDLVVLLQPTSPLRTGRHIDEAVALARDRGAETVVSVVEIQHNCAPESAMVSDDGRLAPYLDAPMILRRQDKKKYLARNGPAILAVRTSVLRRGLLYGTPTFGYEMDRESSVDIDGPEDLWLAEQYLRRRAAAPSSVRS